MTENCEQEYSYLLASLFKSHFEKPLWEATAQKMKFSVNVTRLAGNCEFGHLLKTPFKENLIFCAELVHIDVYVVQRNDPLLFLFYWSINIKNSIIFPLGQLPYKIKQQKWFSFVEILYNLSQCMDKLIWHISVITCTWAHLIILLVFFWYCLFLVFFICSF